MNATLNASILLTIGVPAGDKPISPESNTARCRSINTDRPVETILSSPSKQTCLAELPGDLPESALHYWKSSTDAVTFLHGVASNGGPTSEQHSLVTACFLRLWKDRIPFDVVRDALRITISTTKCMHGFGFLKPHGHAGDFEMIDRIYTFWTTEDPTLRRWDEFFHLQGAPRAVRNRKAYLHDLLRQMEDRSSDRNEIHALNLGSGPARDLYEYFVSSGRVKFDCIDLNQKAIAFAKALCAAYEDRVTFRQKNVLRLRLKKSYDLIWCAGLFDYFSDRVFVRVLRRLTPHIRSGGQIVIGNFSKRNLSRYWMEAVGDWHLHHRSKDELIALGLASGIELHRMKVDVEAEGVNLFLRISG